MTDLQGYLPIAEKAAEVIDFMMIDQMGLMPPMKYELGGRDNRAYLVASFDPLELGRNLKPYENQDVARRLSEALARLPVVITKRTGTRYVVVLSGRPKLPKVVEFPGFGEQDVFRLGVGLKGEASFHADEMRNVIIGAGQGAGKSNILHLLMYQAWQFGWKLYLADPDGHTFNPDIWNKIAAEPVASSPEDVNKLLDRLSGEIADRIALFRQAANGGIPPADLEAYNALVDEPLARIGLFLDEANTSLGDKRVFGKVADLLRRGRKWGLHIFLAGHEWHKENVPAEVNDMLQTRIGLTVATAESSQVVLRDAGWGKWVLRKPEGRGVLRVGKYMPLQFYLVPEEMERTWLSGVEAPKPLPDEEMEIVLRSILEEEGKMTMGFLTDDCGLSDTQARKLAERYEARGWLEKDPENKNARFVTGRLRALLATNSQTPQTATSPHIWPQTGHKQAQTPDMELSYGEG